MREMASFQIENELTQNVIIGVDEVGRGSLAGPVVAGAVCLGSDQKFWMSLGIDDSKRLSAKKRENLAENIKGCAMWGIGEASVSYINRKGIVKATEKAMRAAIKMVKNKSEKTDEIFVLLDAFNVKYIPGCGLKSQKAIIKGDQKSISIAAASVIAKVYRDELMIKLHDKSPEYGFNVNKGYGTKKHLGAIKKHGLKKIHRKWKIGDVN